MPARAGRLQRSRPKTRRAAGELPTCPYFFPEAGFAGAALEAPAAFAGAPFPAAGVASAAAAVVSASSAVFFFFFLPTAVLIMRTLGRPNTLRPGVQRS